MPKKGKNMINPDGKGENKERDEKLELQRVPFGLLLFFKFHLDGLSFPISS